MRHPRESKEAKRAFWRWPRCCCATSIAHSLGKSLLEFHFQRSAWWTQRTRHPSIQLVEVSPSVGATTLLGRSSRAKRHWMEQQDWSSPGRSRRKSRNFSLDLSFNQSGVCRPISLTEFCSPPVQNLFSLFFKQEAKVKVSCVRKHRLE